MRGWRDQKVGDIVHYHVEEFDGTFDTFGVVKEVHDDHLIVRGDDMNLWVDDDTCDLFMFGIPMDEWKGEGLI